MPYERIVQLRGHIPVTELSAIAEKHVGPVSSNSIFPDRSDGVIAYFRMTFREPGAKKDAPHRAIHGHHGIPAADSEFPGEPYTYFSSGAFGITDVMMKEIAQFYQGIYEDEMLQETLDFRPGAAPKP